MESGSARSLIAIGLQGTGVYRLAEDARAAGFRAFAAMPNSYALTSCPELLGLSLEEGRAVSEADSAYADLWLLPPERRTRPDWFVQGPLLWVILHLHALIQGNADAIRRSKDVLSLLHLKAVTQKTGHPQAIVWSTDDLRTALACRNVSDAERESFARGLAYDNFMQDFRAAGSKLYTSEALAGINPPIPASIIDAYASLDPAFAASVKGMRDSRAIFDMGIEVAPEAIAQCGAPRGVDDPLFRAAVAPVVPVLKTLLSSVDLVATEEGACIYPFMAGTVDYAQFDNSFNWRPPASSDPYSRLQSRAYSGARFVFRDDGSWRSVREKTGNGRRLPLKFGSGWIDYLDRLKLAKRPAQDGSATPHDPWVDQLPSLPERSNAQRAALQRGPFRPGASVLHLTNIANNALLNSMILREAGYPSFVAHPDLYHFASQPEWLRFDSDRFDRDDLGNPFFSNWWRFPPEVRTRPRWFAEGPQHLVCSYLRYLRFGGDKWAEASWNALEFNRLKAVTEETTVPQTIVWSENRLEEVMKDLKLTDAEIQAFRVQRRLDDLVEEIRDTAVRFSGAAGLSLAPPFPQGFLDAYFGLNPRLAIRIAAARSTGFAYTSGLEIDPRVQALRLLKPQAVQPGDWQTYQPVLPAWRAMMDQFDVVIAYGAAPNLCYLSGYQPYAAYEHGTIRTLPFVDDIQGRLLRLSYPAAHSVFITNTDYATASNRLEFRNDQRIYAPHVFDERELIRFSVAEGGRRLQASPVTFFAPARHEWKVVSPNAKGNEIVIHAIAEVARERRDFTVIFVNWGPDVQASKEMIAKLGVEDVVTWMNPVPKKQLWRLYLSSNAVIDQLRIPSFSGVLFEAMTMGARCITCDDGANTIFFGEGPPLLSATNVSETAARIKQVIADPLDQAGIGDASVDWIRRHHSYQCFLDKELEAFRKIKRMRDSDWRSWVAGLFRQKA